MAITDLPWLAADEDAQLLIMAAGKDHGVLHVKDADAKAPPRHHSRHSPPHWMSTPPTGRPEAKSGYPEMMSIKEERRAAREKVAAYHDEHLGRLVSCLAEAIDRHRAAEIDAFAVDEVAFQYSRAAKELWKFCNTVSPEIAARMIADAPPIDWWERGASRQP